MNERVQTIYTAIEFVEDHLVEPITVADIAAAAGYSLFHFIRTFNQAVHHTPYDYLMRRRLSEAALVLLDRERRVIDIALEFQFKNHETFTRAFRRLFGMPPTRWRQQGYADHRFIMPALGRDYLDFLNTPDFVPPRLVETDETILTGLMTPLTGDSDEIPTLWQNLRGALRGLLIKAELPDFWGIRFQPQRPNGRFYYLASVKIPSLKSAPAAFVTKIIPAGDYVCLFHANRLGNLDLALVVLYHTYLPKTDLILSEPLEIEHFSDPRETLLPVQGLLKGEFLTAVNEPGASSLNEPI